MLFLPAERAAFEEALRTRRNWKTATVEAKRLFNIYGHGGSGKTWLLREFQHLCLEAGVEYVAIDAKRGSPAISMMRADYQN